MKVLCRTKQTNKKTPLEYKYLHLSSIVLRSNNRKIEMHLFILYNLQLEIINFLYKNLGKLEYCA